jgi:atypical dual specificity phosphatase
MDTITEILPSLFIGGYGGAMNEILLQKYNIKTIITLNKKLKLPHSDNYKYEYYLYDMDDVPSFSIKVYFNEITDIIHDSIEKKNNVLIHCYCGVSRSVSFCIAYLIKYCNMTLVQSYEFIRTKRPIIEPNDGFIKQLQIYYKQSQEELDIYYEYLRIINIIDSIKLTYNNNNDAIIIYKKKMENLKKKINML